MNEIFGDLLNLMELERLEDRLFRGESRDIGSERVFGGQVLGQALMAATLTVEDRKVHSLHAYFLRAGDIHAPIVYDVDVSRDGRSFCNRRVVAIQHGRPILNLAASFQVEEEGIEHQDAMPDVPPPDDLQDAERIRREVVEKAPEKVRRYLSLKRPFEFRPVQATHPLEPAKLPPERQVWFRSLDQIPAHAGDDDESQAIHRALLAYVSDYYLLMTATLPHGITFLHGNVQMASLDHAMWFHRPLRVDEWLLYSLDSPSASGARGLTRGKIFDREGRLVASTAQEGLIRIWPEEKKGAP